jgi:predicted RNA binding protein YcfA (HicA-like mRNA interferase family)
MKNTAYRQIAKEHGFVLVRSNKHAVYKHASGAIVVGPSSPSDSRRGTRQFIKDIKLALAGRIGDNTGVVIAPGK